MNDNAAQREDNRRSGAGAWLRDWSIRTLSRVALSGGRYGVFSILIFHRVLGEKEKFYGDIDVATFDEIIGFLAGNFRVLPLHEALSALRRGVLPSCSVCITFDDGYADNYSLALPVLKKHDVSATFFVSTGYLAGDWMWNDVVLEALRTTDRREIEWTPLGLHERIEDEADRRNLGQRVIQALKYRPPTERDQAAAELAEYLELQRTGPLMMTPDQVRALYSAGMEIGGHTVSHPVLTTIPLSQARQEIEQGRQILRDMTDAPVRFFAYPNGKSGKDYTHEHMELVREIGFEAALSTNWGVAGRDTNMFALPRFTPWDRTPGRFGMRLCQNRLRALLPTQGVG